MNRRSAFKRFAILLVGFFALGLLGIYLFVGDFDVSIDEAQAQAALNAKQAEGPIRHLGVTLDPRTLTIDFKSDNRAEIFADIALDGYGRNATLSGTFKSGIRYDSPNIYLHDIEPVTMDLVWDAETDQEMSDLATVIRDRLSRERESAQNDETRGALDRLLVKNEARLKDTGAAAAKTFFATIPIYDLNAAGTKGSIASLALKDVRFTEEAAIVTLSPRQAIVKIMSFIAVLLLLFGGALLQFLPYARPSGPEEPASPDKDGDDRQIG